jgi:hypothetical protein
MAADLQARMETARATLERACELLLDPSPQSLEDCLALLGAVAAALTGSRAEWEGHAGDPALRAEAGRLREAVHRAGFLLESAAAFHRKWLQILRTKMGGYTAQGDPAEVVCAGRVWLQG